MNQIHLGSIVTKDGRNKNWIKRRPAQDERALYHKTHLIFIKYLIRVR